MKIIVWKILTTGMEYTSYNELIILKKGTCTLFNTCTNKILGRNETRDLWLMTLILK